MAALSTLTRQRLASAMQAAAPRRTGHVSKIVGLNLEVEGIEAAIGDAVQVHGREGALDAEVVAVRDGGCVCMPFGELSGISIGAEAEALGKPLGIRVGPQLLGRVLDGLGRPIDGGPPLLGLDEV